MGRSVVMPFLSTLLREDPEEARRLILRELDLHGGSPAKVARAMGMPLPTFQCIVARAGLQSAAQQARDRWYRMFSLGGKNGG